MTGSEAWVLVQFLKGIFETVNLVDGERKELLLDSHGICGQIPYCCCAMKRRRKRCELCVVDRCLAQKKKIEKYEYVGSDVYRVIGVYLVVDGIPCCLEMGSEITEEILFVGYDKADVIEMMLEHNKKFYLDPVSEVYNRRFFEEQLGKEACADAVAFMDVDNFKRINDYYGHQTGDVALKLIASAIRSSVRRSDMVIRYGGDEYIVVFESIPRDAFARKLKEIADHVSAVRIESLPELRFSVSIGGYYGPGRVCEMTWKADERMYEAKRNKIVRDE